MAKARKDNRGRALRKGESQRQSDLMYIYTYTDPFGKRKYTYSKDLVKLREKEQKLLKDQLDGLDVYAAGNANLNFVFDRYISTKTELRRTTYTNYMYMYDHYVRDSFGKKKIGEIKYSDVLYFYYHLINERKLQVNTLETIHTVLHPTFQLAVRDDIIRNNPSHGVMSEIKKKPGRNHGVRHALTVEQQRAFMNYTSNSPVFNHWAPLFTVLLGTGCRIGEIIGIRWEDIDLEKRLININHSVTYYPRRAETTKCEFAVSLPKTEAGIRTVPMMEPVYNAFMEEYEYQKENGFSTVTLDGMEGFIFTNRFGNLHNPQAVNRTIKRIRENYNAEEILKAGKFPLLLGGEHLVTLGAVRAAAAKYPDLHIIHFDAHADLRDDYLGAKLSHACVLRRCHEIVGDGHIHQFCIRSGEREEFQFASRHTDFHPFTFEGLEETIRELKEKQVPVYFTIDLDCMDPSVFPGTGTPEAGGVSFLELLKAIRTVSQANVVGADVNELAPMLDASGVSTATACKVLRELLLAIAK